MPFLPNGIGSSLGDALVTGAPLSLSGDVWYVHHTGTDAASPAGKQSQKPLATLAQAHTNAASGDIIVLQDGHTETISTLVTVSKDVVIVGAGQADGKPTVKLTAGTAEVSEMILFSGTTQGLRNIWLVESAAATTGRINITNSGTMDIRGCYVECGEYDNATTMTLGTGVTSMSDTTIISTSTDVTSQPYAALGGANGGTVIMNGVTIDGGTVGWGHTHAVDFDAAVSSITLHAQALSMLRGSDILLDSSAVYHLNIQTSSGAVRQG